MIECSWVYAYIAPFVVLLCVPIGVAIMLVAGTIWCEKESRFLGKLVGSLWVLMIGIIIATMGVGAGADFVTTCF